MTRKPPTKNSLIGPDEHKFKTGKYSYKEAVIDELTTASPSEYLTKISIQVF